MRTTVALAAVLFVAACHHEPTLAQRACEH